MFFMIGISQGSKEFEYHRMVTCAKCGRLGSYVVYMTYTVLSLFFIPCFKWDKHYYVRMSCCGTEYELNPEVGKRIAKGEDVDIMPGDLTDLSSGFGYAGGAWTDQPGSSQTSKWANWKNEVKTCSNCGYTTDEDFDFCPKCGQKF